MAIYTALVQIDGLTWGNKRKRVHATIKGAVACIPPNLESKSGTTSPHFWPQVSSPTFGLEYPPALLGVS